MSDNKNIELEIQLSDSLKKLYKENSISIYKNIDEKDFNNVINLINNKNLDNLLNIKELDLIKKYLEIIFIFSNDYKIFCYLFTKSFHEMSIYEFLFELYFLNDDIKSLDNIIIDIIKLYLSILPLKKNEIKLFYQKISNNYYTKICDNNYNVTEESLKKLFDLFFVLNINSNNKNDINCFFYKYYNNPIEMDLFSISQQIASNGITIILNFNILNHFLQNDNIDNIEIIKLENLNNEKFIINCQYIKNSDKFIFTSSNYDNNENEILFEVNSNKNKKNNIKLFLSLTNEYKKCLFFHFYVYNYSQEEEENELIIPYSITMKKYPIKNYNISKSIKNISLFKNFFGEINSIQGIFYGINCGYYDYIIEENIINKINFENIFEKLKENILEDNLYKNQLNSSYLEKNYYFFLYDNNINKLHNNNHFEYKYNENKYSILDFYKNCKLVYNDDTFFIQNFDNLTYFSFHNSFNNYLPLFDIFLKYQDYINFNDLLEKIFIIIKNLIINQKNIINLNEKEIIKILSLFLEEFKEKFFIDNLLKNFNDIYHLLNNEEIKVTFKKYILANEAIINKFKKSNLILNEDEIFNNIVEKNFKFYNNIKYICCEFHNKNEIKNIEDFNNQKNLNNIFKEFFNSLEDYYLINQDKLFIGIKKMIKLIKIENICPCLINCIISFIKYNHSKIKFENFIVSNIINIFFKLLTNKYLDIKINVLDLLFDIIVNYFDYLSEIHFNELIPKNLFMNFNYSNKIEFIILINKLLFYINPKTSQINIYEKIELIIYNIIICFFINLCEKNNFFQFFYYLMIDNFYKKNINIFYDSLYFLFDLFNKEESLIPIIIEELKNLYSNKYIYNESYEKYFYIFLYYLNYISKNNFEFISEENKIIKTNIQQILFNFFNDMIIFGQLTEITEESKKLIKFITNNKYDFIILEFLYDLFKNKYNKFILEKKNYDDFVEFCDNFRLFLIFLDKNSYENIKNNNYIIQNVILKTLKFINSTYKENDYDKFNLYKITFLKELIINLSNEHFKYIEFFHSAFEEYFKTNELKGVLKFINSLAIKYTESAEQFNVSNQIKIIDNINREKSNNNILFSNDENNNNENKIKEKKFNQIIKKFNIFYSYRKLKKSCFYFNGYWTNNELFFGERKLNYKIKNFYTNNLNRPLLYPIIFFNEYQNKYLSGDEIYVIKKENNLTLNINKEIFEQNINKYNITNDDYDNYLINKYKIEEIFFCCLVKYFRHIKGFIVINKNKIYFFSFYNQANKFCYKNKTCYGTLFENENNFPKNLKIDINSIVLISKKNYFYGDTGLEIYTNEGKIFYFNFTDSKYINKIFENDIIKKFTSFKNNLEKEFEYDNLFYNPNSNYFYSEFNDKIGFKNEINFNDLVIKWNYFKISNILFLNLLNILCNRSYIDLYQYMIFPKLILNKDDSFKMREFELSIKSLNKTYFEDNSNEFYQTFLSVCENLKNIFPFVFQYLKTFYKENEIERITLLEDNNDENIKLFHESSPEFLYLPEIFKNINNIDEIKNKNENEIENISDYIEKEFNELELNEINQYNIWLDNIFGVNQKYNENEVNEKFINNKNNNEKYHNNEPLLENVESGLYPYQITNKKFPKLNNTIKDSIYTLLNIEKYETEIKEISDPLKIIFFNKTKLINKDEFISINKKYLYLSFEDKKIYFSKQMNQNSLFANYFYGNNLNYFSNNNIVISNKGEYVFISGQFNVITFLIKKDDYKEHIINLRTFDLKTIINTLCLIEKKISYLLCGDINGNIIIFQISNIYSLDLNKVEENFLSLYKYFSAHLLEINHIYYSEDLNMFCTCSNDNFMNVYIFPECKIVNCLKYEYSIDYCFIIENPYPLIIFYSYKSTNLLIYSLNSEFIKKENINYFIDPQIYKDDFQLSYLTYLSDLNTFSVYPLNIYGKNKVSNIKIEFNVFNYNISNDFKFLIFSELKGKRFYIIKQNKNLIKSDILFNLYK